MSSRYPQEPNAPAARIIRTWANPADSRIYRVVLEAAAPHRVRHGDRRSTLTFVDVTEAKVRQLTTLVPEGFPLEHATTTALAKLLREAD